MTRAAIICVGLCFGLGALPARAQGVPTQDNSAIGRAIARVTALAEDLGVQQDTRGSRWSQRQAANA
jgi:hypothetical protein